MRGWAPIGVLAAIAAFMEGREGRGSGGGGALVMQIG